MNSAVELKHFSFHDTSLIAAPHHGSTIILTVEYFTDDDVEASLSATISGIEAVLRDDVPIQTFEMETADGEIFRLKHENHELTLIVYWHTYSPNSSTMRIYRIFGANLELQLEPMT